MFVSLFVGMLEAFKCEPQLMRITPSDELSRILLKVYNYDFKFVFSKKFYLGDVHI